MIEQEIRTVWQGYKLHVEGLNPILERMSERGIPVSKARLDEFEEEVANYRDQSYRRLCEIYPQELLPAKQAKGLKKPPADTTGYLQREFEDDIAIYTFWEEDCTCKKGCKKCNKTRKVTKKSKKPDHFEHVRELRWYQPKEFKPSYHQIAAYIQHKGHKLPTRATKKEEARGKEAATTDKTALSQLHKKTGDEFYDLVVKYRNYDKMIQTYVRGWTPKGDGRVHSSYLFRPATGQLSSVNPNVQNCPSDKSGALAVKFKSCVVARPGRTLLEFDWAGLHAFMLGFLAGDKEYMRLSRLGVHDFLAAHLINKLVERDGLEKATRNYARLVDPKNPKPNLKLMDETKEMLQNLDSWLSYDDVKLGEYLGWVKKNHKVYRNKVKPCIAEGQLVLTDKGLVPIEKVTLKHKVWDGVEWVTHDGVVYKGVKEVIEHDGLRATPDHIVYTRDGRKIPFGEAKRTQVKLETTELGGQAVRTSYNHFVGDDASEGILEGSGSLPGLWPRNELRLVLTNTGTYSRLRSMREGKATLFRKATNAWESLRQDLRSLQPRIASGLSLLRWTGNPMQIQVQSGVCTLGRRELTSRRLCWSGAGQDRQRWALRAREFEARHAQGADSQYQSQPQGILARGVNTLDTATQSVQFLLHNETGQAGNDRRGDLGVRQDKQRQSCSGTFARVYDIVNAGPRRRFTCSSQLTSNCVHGYGFGLGAFKLWKGYQDNFSSPKEASEPLNMLNNIFPLVAKYREDVKELADRQGHLISPFGFIRYFNEVFRKQQVKEGYEPKFGERLVRTKDGRLYKIGSGQDAEKAIAFLPANCSFGYVRDCMLRIAERGLDERFCMINQVHDSLMFECRDELVDECIELVLEEMQRPNKCLVSELAPEGLRCYAGVSIGDDWGHMKEIS